MKQRKWAMESKRGIEAYPGRGQEAKEGETLGTEGGTMVEERKKTVEGVGLYSFFSTAPRN